MNAIIAEAEKLDSIVAIEAPEVLGEFKIVADAKRTIKASCSGQVIEALKRAKSPIKLSALASRVRMTKSGKDLKVKDIRARVKKCVEWYVKDSSCYVSKNDSGEYFLTRVKA